MPLYEEKLISPLAIRFSQPRIRSTFRDGHTLEESLAQIATVTAPPGSSHDALLAAPFPPIEVVRWQPKLRDANGSALLDESGEAVRGEECWFTLDNRRLYCLQKAAAQALPHSAAAVVHVMYDIPTVKSIARKFKTTTSGISVKIAAHHDEAPISTWGWQALPNIAGLRAQGPCAGLCQVQVDTDTRDHALLEDAPLDGGLCIAFAVDSAKSTDDSSSASDKESTSGDDLIQPVKSNQAPAVIYEPGQTMRALIHQRPVSESLTNTGRGHQHGRRQSDKQQQHDQQHQLLLGEYLPREQNRLRAQAQQQQLHQHQQEQQLHQQQLLLEQHMMQEHMASAQHLWLLQRQQQQQQEQQLMSMQQVWMLQQQQQQQHESHQEQLPQQQAVQQKQSLFSQLQRKQHVRTKEQSSYGAPWDETGYSWVK